MQGRVMRKSMCVHHGSGAARDQNPRLSPPCISLLPNVYKTVFFFKVVLLAGDDIRRRRRRYKVVTDVAATFCTDSLSLPAREMRDVYSCMRTGTPRKFWVSTRCVEETDKVFVRENLSGMGF